MKIKQALKPEIQIPTASNQLIRGKTTKNIQKPLQPNQPVLKPVAHRQNPRLSEKVRR